jgi:hypothetical protein
MPNFLRLLLGGLIALGAILVTLFVGALVLVGSVFGLIASRFRGGAKPHAARAKVNGASSPRRRSVFGGTGRGDVIDVEVTDVTDAATSPAPRLRG